jgi:hypothetical protein
MSWDDALRHHVERRLQVELEIPAPEPDEDGDYGWVEDNGGPVVWIRPGIGMEPMPVRVWSLAARGVKKTAALLTELNSWNIVLPGVRVVWEDGCVRVWGDRVIQSLEPGELGFMVRHTAQSTRRISEVICTVYGGTCPWPQLENEPSGGAVDL